MTYSNDMILLVGLVILVAVVASFTRLAYEDVITAPWRARLREKRGDQNFWVRALECFRCSAVWVSPLPTAAALVIWGYSAQASWIWWLILALAWIPVSKGIAYLAFILYIRGEA